MTDNKTMDEFRMDWWGRPGSAEIPGWVERLEGETRIGAAIRTIEDCNPGLAVVTCRRDGWERRRSDGRALSETYQMSLADSVTRFGASVSGEIWVRLDIEDGVVGPASVPNLLRSVATRALPSVEGGSC